MEDSAQKINAKNQDENKPENASGSPVVAEQRSDNSKQNNDKVAQEQPDKSVAEDEGYHKKKRTLGNKIYDFGVFGTIAWLGVSAISAVTAHEAIHGNNKYFNWLRTLTGGLEKGLHKSLSNGILKNAKKETVDGYAKNTALVFALGMGGHTLMAPIKWLEDHRQSNAAKIDKMLGTTPPDSEEIQKEPKQSWRSVLGGRLISWGSAFGVATAVGPKLTSQVNDYFGEKGAKLWMSARPKTNPASARKWSDIISFDLIFTALTATVTWACSRMLAKQKPDKLDEIEEGLYQLNPIAPNPLGEDEEHQSKNQSSHRSKVSAADEKKATAFVDKIKRQEKSHEAAAAFIDKIKRDENVAHAMS